MNPRSAANGVQLTLNTLDRLNAPVPDETRRALEDGIVTANAVGAWRPVGADVTSAAYAAVRAGRDPGADKKVHQALLAERLFSVRDGVAARAGDELAALVRDHLEALVSAFDAAYQRQCVAPLREALQTLTARGIGVVDDPAVVLRAGHEVATAWSTMMTAADAHRQILGAYKRLLQLADVPVGSDHTFLWVDPGDVDLIVARNVGRTPHPWAVLDAGMTLGITSPAGAAERQDRAAQVMARQQEHADGAFRRGHRAVYGIGGGGDAA